MNSWKSLLFGGATRAGVRTGASIRPGAGRLIADLSQQIGHIIVGVERSGDEKKRANLP